MPTNEGKAKKQQSPEPRRSAAPGTPRAGVLLRPRKSTPSPRRQGRVRFKDVPEQAGGVVLTPGPNALRSDKKKADHENNMARVSQQVFQKDKVKKDFAEEKHVKLPWYVQKRMAKRADHFQQK